MGRKEQNGLDLVARGMVLPVSEYGSYRRGEDSKISKEDGCKLGEEGFQSLQALFWFLCFL